MFENRWIISILDLNDNLGLICIITHNAPLILGQNSQHKSILGLTIQGLSNNDGSTNFVNTEGLLIALAHKEVKNIPIRASILVNGPHLAHCCSHSGRFRNRELKNGLLKLRIKLICTRDVYCESCAIGNWAARVPGCHNSNIAAIFLIIKGLARPNDPCCFVNIKELEDLLLLNGILNDPISG